MKKNFITVISTIITIVSITSVQVQATDIKNSHDDITLTQEVTNSQRGWVKIDGKFYHYDENGNMSKGWLNDGGTWYYLDKQSGVMQTGWLNDGGTWYYLSKQSGAMQTGWLNDGGTWYYLDKQSGAMQTGWLHDGYDWYYLNEQSGAMQTGWIYVDGRDYYMNSNGTYYTGNKIVSEAYKHLGKPYVWGATGPNSFDCSGLTQYVYKQLGYNISRTTYTQIKDGISVSRNNLLPGDLIFPNADHVGIYIGGNKYIHAPKPGDVVKISTLPNNLYGARRIVK